MIDPTIHEKAAMQAALKPLGEYVASIGMHRGLANYTKEEILTLVEVTVTAYHDHLRSPLQRNLKWDASMTYVRSSSILVGSFASKVSWLFMGLLSIVRPFSYL